MTNSTKESLCGSEFKICNNSVYSYNPHAVTLQNGEVFIAYQSSITNYHQIYANILFENGTKSGDDWQINNGSATSTNNYQPHSVILDNGDLAITWWGNGIRAEVYT